MVKAFRCLCYAVVCTILSSCILPPRLYNADFLNFYNDSEDSLFYTISTAYPDTFFPSNKADCFGYCTGSDDDPLVFVEPHSHMRTYGNSAWGVFKEHSKLRLMVLNWKDLKKIGYEDYEFFLHFRREDYINIRSAGIKAKRLLLTQDMLKGQDHYFAVKYDSIGNLYWTSLEWHSNGIDEGLRDFLGKE